MRSFLARATTHFITGICAVQALAWGYGYFDELTALVKESRECAVLGTIAYFVVYYVFYDAPRQAAQLRYNTRLKGASKRLPAKKRDGSAVPISSKRQKKV